MHTKISLMVVAGMLVLGSAHAQERAAGSAMETQMTWSTLSNKIGQVDGKVSGVKVLVDQTIVCARKGMFYAPGEDGLDTQGCKEAHKVNENTTNISSLVTAINNLTNSYKTLNNNVTSIINCNKNGQMFNGSACIASGSNIISITAKNAQCPANTKIVSCMGPSNSNVSYSGNGCKGSHTQSKSTGNTGGWEGSWTVEDAVTIKCIAN